MRLLSAKVRNYRIHEDLSVKFSDSLTLIGGKNESGKSTLVEAIHRALFLKAKIGGKVQESMQSDLHSGHPEVTVRFEAGGTEWEIHKAFAKASGKATLREEGGATLRDAEAEARLAGLMQVEEAAGGQRGARESQEQWAHLWVWQGCGGLDPSEHAAAQRDALLSRLEEEGGGAVMQSDEDGRVANAIREEFEKIFTKTGQPKAGSDLQRADQEREAAEREREEAQSALARLEEAMRSYEEAEAILGSGEKAIAELESELAAARKRSTGVKELDYRIESELQASENARKQRDQFREGLAGVQKLAGEVEGLEKELRPGAERRRDLEKKIEESRATVERTVREAEQAETELARTRDRRDLCEAWGRFLKQREDRAALEKERSTIGAIAQERREFEKRLATLPPIDEATYRELQRAESSRNENRARLEAMSTGIEVIEADAEVRVDGEALESRNERILDREARLLVGDRVEIRIRPGGGNELDQVREQTAAADAERDRAFREAAVPDLEAAGRARAERETLESKLGEAKARLGDRNVEGIREALEEADREIAVLEAEIERRSEGVGEFPTPADAGDARARWEELRDEISARTNRLEEARAELAAARESLRSLEEEREGCLRALQSAEHSLIEKKALLEAKSGPLGPEEERAAKQAALDEALAAAEKKLTESRAERARLQPDTIEADLERLDRALDRKKDEISSSRERRAVARNILASDGTTDPSGRLASARARAESAAERHRNLRIRAEAIRRLHQRFSEEQQKLSDRFSRPLAEKVSVYLRHLFGPTASATVEIEEGIVGGWRMTREGGSFDFSDLSGGTREQVAAAIRLALAEVLAPDHGGVLPVVFDDAFTNSDPDRIRNLQRMLDIASRHGLQIILLTCTPEDYDALGAETVSLGASRL